MRLVGTSTAAEYSSLARLTITMGAAATAAGDEPTSSVSPCSSCSMHARIDGFQYSSSLIFFLESSPSSS
eukprot:CAMPEP_0168259428 /NCGR_PEP_ID=MMETSP0141_2-20121125/7739_1 /TAXON_ID=44445 /ORGANISM="Pseudo-nitzschia australis, Strain 10249 10 AB" /LENGTH=69 /DNA_ID=CAMNT_0008196907 /DNA_START=611 /DNA_END=820 /DNA_ORIENTATION=+